MPALNILRVIFTELTTRERQPRVPEPDLVMDDPAKVAAYTRAGREDGVMAPTYLFHTLHMSEVIRPGDVVLDLACGPATQLAQLARLNPDVRFVGVDLSREMLERGWAHLRAEGLDNVDLCEGDISDLSGFADASVDAVVSSMALHHLPDIAALRRCFERVSSLLRPGGGIYMADFGRLRAASSMRAFAEQYVHKQPQLFTEEYMNSLQAAFSVEDFRSVASALPAGTGFHTTAGGPFMVVFKSACRRQLPEQLVRQLRGMRDSLPVDPRGDFRQIARAFAVKGLRPSFAL